MEQLTAINILLHLRCLHTLIHRGIPLRLRVRSRAVNHTRDIHQLLQRIALPSKHVISMITIARPVTERPNERLGSVRRPVGFVVEFRRVPDDLEEHLRHAYWVSIWAWGL